MPRITLANALNYITEVELHLDYSRQSVLTARYSLRREVIDFASAEWVGTFAIGEPLDEMEARTINAFLDGFDGQSNTFLLEHDRPTVATGVSARVASRAMDSNGNLVHTLSSSLADLTVGMMLTGAGKVYSVREVAGTSLVLDPQRPIAVGQAITRSTTIEVRNSASEHPPNPHGKLRWGPWEVPFVEA